jgi:hypothetical protein
MVMGETGLRMSKSPTAELGPPSARQVRPSVVVIEVRLVGTTTIDAWPSKSGRSQSFVQAVCSFVARRHRPVATTPDTFSGGR